MMNAQFSELSEKLDCFFPDSLKKIKFHIFQNTSKYSIHVLITFKYKNICELCDDILEKDKRGRINAKKCFVLHEEVIYVFHEKNYITTIEKLSFNLTHVRIIGSMECGNTRNYCFRVNASKNNEKLKKDYSEKFSEKTGI